MRSSVAILVASWIVGVFLGVFHGPEFILLACVSFFVFLSHRLAMPTQVFLAIAGLILLGFFYGEYAVRSHVKACEAQSAVKGAILDRAYSLAPTQALYVFTRDDGCALLVYTSRFPILVRGTQADILGTQEPVEVAFKGVPGYAKFLADNGISLVVREADVLVVQKGELFIDRVRIAVTHRIAELFPEPDASVLSAMLVGDSAMIPKIVQEEYRQSGITHILSISGLHISIIVGLFVIIGEFLPLPVSIRNVVIIGGIWVYVFAIGFPPSAVRASVFWTCYVLAYRLRALLGLPTVLLLTLAFLLTVNPIIARSIGLQLSVVAVSGIGVAIFFLRRIRLAPGFRALVMLFGTSLGATIASAPLTAFYFHNVSFVGILVNAVAIPLSVVALYGALFTLVASTVFTPLALFCAFFVHHVLALIEASAVIGGYIPYGHIENLTISGKVLAGYYAVLVIAICISMRYFRIPWRQWWI